MTLRELLSRRRMVRNYQDRPVPRELVEEILELARRAPSAGFSQGQRFLVLTEPARRQRLAELAGEDAYRERGFPPWLSIAPVHVLLAVDRRAYQDRYAEPDKTASNALAMPYAEVDAGASLMLILLGAVERGLAAGFLGAHNLPGAEDAFGFGPACSLIGLVTLGYAAPDRKSGSLARGRLPVERQVFWETFSSSR